jgi:hypothetical protein
MRPQIAIVFLTTLTPLAQGDEPKGPTAYRVAVDGNIKITTDQNNTVTRHTQAELDYRVARTKDGVEVGIDRFGFRITANNQELDHVEMNRSRITSRRIDRPIDIRRNDAPPAILPLFAQFDPPLVTLKLDVEGAEQSRKARDEGGPLLGSRVVDLCRLFHPRFPKNESKWETPVVIPFGRGQHANGVLRYSKRPADEKDGLVAVDVTGFLKVTGTHDAAEIKRGDYKVSGRQTFDTAANEWSSGKLIVAISFDALLPNGRTFHGGGPATYTLARRDLAAKTKSAKKKP